MLSPLQVRSLCADSRSLQAGDVFVAYPGHAGAAGQRADGRRFIADALGRGAAGVLWEREGFAWNAAWQVPNAAVDGLKPLVGAISSEVYGFPSEQLFMAGVTGTNGKTSVSQWIAQALHVCGKPCGVIGTLGASLYGGTTGLNGAGAAADAAAASGGTANTTPDAIVLQRTLKQMREAGAVACAMEVSSIGLDQARVGGTAFDCAVFTNFTRDHLDYHGSMAAYEAAKTQLFLMEGLTHAVINLDDPMGVRLMAKTANRLDRIAYCIAGAAPVARYVEDEGRLTASEVRFNEQGARFTVTSDWGVTDVAAPVWGLFNVSNLLAVIGTLIAAGVPFESAARAVEQIHAVPGRMNALGGKDAPLVVIDYAHTPDALEQALATLRPLATARGGALRIVFGCGGDRDAGKRPLMGAVAERGADAVMLTSDNPRSEAPEAIIAAIAHGMHKPHLVVADRAQAIARAVGGAGAADVVLIAGKGHERYQEMAGRKLPFSDHDVARKAIDNRPNSARSAPSAIGAQTANTAQSVNRSGGVQ